MRIFLIKRKTLFLFMIMMLCAGFLFMAGVQNTAEVFNDEWGEEKLLPIYRVEKGEEKVCALTFDAAWDDHDTDELIKILNENEVKATFFVVGDWARKYPESVKKFADNGHEIMNHSNTHPHIDQLSEQKVKEEISACADTIESITGVRPTLFRGPYGEYNNTVIKVAKEQGETVLQWDVETLATLGKPDVERV